MKLKNILVIVSLLIVMMLAVACSTDAETPQASSDETQTDQTTETADSSAQEPAQSGEFTQPERQQVQSTNLIMATFQLESTDYAVTTEQAAELLPLWKVYQTLIESSTAAELEREALLTQIAGVMTDEQMSYLDSDEIDPQQTAELMAELGIETGFGGMGGERPEGEDGEFEGAPGGGGDMPAEMQGMGGGQGDGTGGGPGGGMGGMGGGEMDAEQLATMQAERAENGGGARGGDMDETLLPALIEFLEAKIES